MKHFFSKPRRAAALFSLLLAVAMAFVLLDTFVFPKAYAQQQAANPAAAPQAGSTGSGLVVAAATQPGITPVTTAASYRDDNIEITIETVRAYDTTFYVADIRVSSAAYLQTAFAQGVYGRNIKAATSDIAEQSGAVFAINGDYYGFRDTGYVIRNGVLYREVPTGGDVLVIDQNGHFSTVDDRDVTARQLLDAGAWQVLSFGPALVDGGAVVVGESEEISGKSMNSNPRTAIGQIDTLHYIVIVSDGRTDESAGLSLHQLATELAERGAVTAYNLDGGGSSTMVLNGQVINTTVNGRGSSERQVSDIVYIGYPAQQ